MGGTVQEDQGINSRRRGNRVKIFQQLTTKQKQRLKVISVVALFLAALFVGSTLLEKGGQPKEERKVRHPRKFSILSEKVEKDLWVAAEGQNIRALEKSNEELRNELERLRKELEEVRKKQERVTQEKSSKEKPLMPPVPLPEPPRTSETRTTQGKKLLPEADVKSSKEKGPGSVIRVFESKPQERSQVQKKTRVASKAKEHETVFIPTGSITRGVILAGMDVPTSMSVKLEPYPVLLMLTDYSILPNRFRMDLKECFVVGAGYGSIVEERAYIRTETLSCVKKDGTPWEYPLKGQVIGEDGKLGLRGRVVSKQGRQIALSIVTGILAGLGDAFTPRAAFHFVDVTKEEDRMRFLSPNLKDVLTASTLTGVGKALDKVADYYLKLAEQMFPVIEINAGREVEIVVIKGGEIKPAPMEHGGEKPRNLESKEKKTEGGQVWKE